ncbi:hypothetical protein B0T20DRAFT_456069 [Sordaria brevicollis]|uniref:Uncharacterized protein n=1 Tax=Sordaria brevicollis TaxID=83679 RepID=A0AAE0P3P3_SORBR|nr:hypothetical protein B0T20DRAFT_456069 [Sordaria brevicollis]
MPWIHEAEQNPWLSSSSEDEAFPPVHPKLDAGSEPTIKEESRDTVVLEISSSSPSPHPNGKDNEGQKDGQGAAHSSPSRPQFKSPGSGISGGPSVVNGGGSSYAYGTRSHAHTSQSFVVRNSSSPAAAAVARLKRRSSSASLSPAPTEDSSVDDDNDEDEEDDDNDGAEVMSHVRDPPCFQCLNMIMRGKDWKCYGPARMTHERRTCINCRKARRRCRPAPELVVQAMKTLKHTCAAYRNLQELVKIGMVPDSAVETLLSGGDPYETGVPSRGEFAALMRRVKSLEASVQLQKVLRGRAGARTKPAGRRKPDEAEKDEKDPELPDNGDYEQTCDEDEGRSDGEDEWLP